MKIYSLCLFLTLPLQEGSILIIFFSLMCNSLSGPRHNTQILFYLDDHTANAVLSRSYLWSSQPEVTTAVPAATQNWLTMLSAHCPMEPLRQKMNPGPHANEAGMLATRPAGGSY